MVPVEYLHRQEQPGDFKMTRLSEQNRTLLENYLSRNSKWKKNRFGNFEDTTGKYRVKFQDTSFRIESKVVHDSGYIKSSWVKIGGGYYKDVTFADGCVLVNNRQIRKEFF